MLKIKVFKFRVSNAASAPCKGDRFDDWFLEKQCEIVSEKDIEETVNNFIASKDIVDIKINSIDVQYNNNARGNTVDLMYTIMYRE